jgi:hypothetical protein
MLSLALARWVVTLLKRCPKLGKTICMISHLGKM